MNSKVTVIVDENSADFSEKLHEAAAAIKSGGLVVFPTETVFGLGANALDAAACKKIYLAKGRPQDNPLIIHVSSLEMAGTLMREEPEDFKKLAETFMPGPISLVCKKSELVSDVASGGLDTVAVRMPDNPIALKLIELAGLPIAAPSANISGRPSPTRNEHVINDLNGRADYIITSTELPIGVESTVIDISGEKPIIYRPGGISKERIELVLGKKVEVYSAKASDSEKVLSPGIKYKHYSPDALVLEAEKNLSEEELLEIAEKYSICREKLLYIEYGSDVEMAKNLYADFRKADKSGFSLLIIKAPEEGELLAAVLNRLGRAGKKL